MKKIFLILILTLMFHNLKAQKKGFNEIQIGEKLDHIVTLHKYKIRSDTTKKNTWLVTEDSLRIFLTDVEHLKIEVDNNNIITRIDLYTKPRVFYDYKDWLSELKYVINAVNADVGKLNSDNLSRPSSKELWLAWSFVDTKTALFFVVPKINQFAWGFKENYRFSWVKDERNIYDKKF